MAQINDSQKVLLTVKPLTSSNKPAALNGVPFWSISDVNIATLDVSPDGLSAWVISNSPGSAVVTVAANADFSGGVREISASLDIQVTITEAATLEISVGTPVSK
jgi:hypothetical protein